MLTIYREILRSYFESISKIYNESSQKPKIIICYHISEKNVSLWKNVVICIIIYVHDALLTIKTYFARKIIGRLSLFVVWIVLD